MGCAVWRCRAPPCRLCNRQVIIPLSGGMPASLVPGEGRSALASASGHGRLPSVCDTTGPCGKVRRPRQSMAVAGTRLRVAGPVGGGLRAIGSRPVSSGRMEATTLDMRTCTARESGGCGWRRLSGTRLGNAGPPDNAAVQTRCAPCLRGWDRVRAVTGADRTVPDSTSVGRGGGCVGRGRWLVHRLLEVNDRLLSAGCCERFGVRQQ